MRIDTRRRSPGAPVLHYTKTGGRRAEIGNGTSNVIFSPCGRLTRPAAGTRASDAIKRKHGPVRRTGRGGHGKVASATNDRRPGARDSPVSAACAFRALPRYF